MISSNITHIEVNFTSDVSGENRIHNVPVVEILIQIDRKVEIKCKSLQTQLQSGKRL